MAGWLSLMSRAESREPRAEHAELPALGSRLSTLRSLSLVCRYILAAVFLMAAVTKIANLRGFAYQLDLHSGLPEDLSVVIAAVLPWLELTCGLCLALGRAVREAAF